MMIKKVLDDLFLLPNVKVIRSSQNELRQWQTQKIVENLRLPSDYEWFLSHYEDFAINNQNLDFFIGGLSFFSEQFTLPNPTKKEMLDSNTDKDSTSLRELIGSLHFAGLSLYKVDELSINVYFSWNLVEQTKICYQINITDSLSGRGFNDKKRNVVHFKSENVMYTSSFASFLLEVPKLITKQGLQELINTSGIDFEISKVGTYQHLREEIPLSIEDGLPF